MDIQELENRLRCLQCEAAGTKIHPLACDAEFGDIDCQAHVIQAHWELIKLWEPTICGSR